MTATPPPADHGLPALLRRNRWRRAGPWVTPPGGIRQPDYGMPRWIAHRWAIRRIYDTGCAYDLDEGAPYSYVFDVARRLRCEVHDKSLAARRDDWRHYGPGLSAAYRAINALSRCVPF